MNCTVAASWPFVVFMLTASGRRVSPFSFSPHTSPLRSAWLGREVEGNGGFPPLWVRLESGRWNGHRKSEASRSVNRADGECVHQWNLWISFPRFIFLVRSMFVRCIDTPWIRQWLTENLYNKVGGKVHELHIYGCFLLAQCSFIKVNTTILLYNITDSAM